MTLANGIYDDAEDQNIALEQAQKYIATQKRPSRSGNDTGYSDPTSGNAERPMLSSITTPDKLAQNIAMRFKDSESKFSGDIGECW